MRYFYLLKSLWIKSVFLNIILFLIISIFFGSCSTDSSEKVHTNQIISIIEEVKNNFNHYEIDQILYYYDDEFYHNGKNKNQIEIKWMNRMEKYNDLQIDNYHVNISLPFATAEFYMIFSNNNSFHKTHEPSVENGDLSFFLYDNGRWKIIGNFKD